MSSLIGNSHSMNSLERESETSKTNFCQTSKRDLVHLQINWTLRTLLIENKNPWNQNQLILPAFLPTLRLLSDGLKYDFLSSYIVNSCWQLQLVRVDCIHCDLEFFTSEQKVQIFPQISEKFVPENWRNH